MPQVMKSTTTGSNSSPRWLLGGFSVITHATTSVGQNHRCANSLEGRRIRTAASSNPSSISAAETKSSSGCPGRYQKVGSGVT